MKHTYKVPGNGQEKFMNTGLTHSVKNGNGWNCIQNIWRALENSVIRGSKWALGQSGVRMRRFIAYCHYPLLEASYS